MWAPRNQGPMAPRLAGSAHGRDHLCDSSGLSRSRVTLRGNVLSSEDPLGDSGRPAGRQRSRSRGPRSRQARLRASPPLAIPCCERRRSAPPGHRVSHQAEHQWPQVPGLYLPTRKVNDQSQLRRSKYSRVVEAQPRRGHRCRPTRSCRGGHFPRRGRSCAIGSTSLDLS